MAHFAELDENNVVLRVIVVNNETIEDLPFPESESVGIEFCRSIFGEGGTWVQTSYNDNFRERFGEVGFSYNAEQDCFVRPQPFPSWVFDLGIKDWAAPIPAPSEDAPYFWDEETQSWLPAPKPPAD